jgi:hypothetical protein
MPVPPPTVDEPVAHLKRSSMPTLLVEGTTDASVCRHLEERFNLPAGTVLHCCGRDCLLALFRRQYEFKEVRTAFLADRDMWLFSAIPRDYEEVLFTCGYSIENDVLDGEAVERLLDRDEAKEFQAVIDGVCRWFALEVDKALKGIPATFDIHVNQLIPPGKRQLDPKWCQQYDLQDSPAGLFVEIRSNYRTKPRGKQLLQCLVRFLSATSRASKFSKANVLEIATKSPEHNRLDTLARAVQSRLLGA